MKNINADKPKKIKRYNVVKHQIWIISLMIVIVIILAFSLPWIIGAIELCFRNSKYWGYELIDENGNLTDILNLSLLADFLGGLIGIIIGFLMELHFVEKLKILNQYKILLKSIKRELVNILTAYKENKDSEKTDDFFKSIDFIILDDVVKSIDKESIVYNLPRMFPFYRRGNKGEIHKKLQDMYSQIKEYNKLFEKYAEIREERNEIRTYINNIMETQQDDKKNFKYLINKKRKDDERKKIESHKKIKEMIKIFNSLKASVLDFCEMTLIKKERDENIELLYIDIDEDVLNKYVKKEEKEESGEVRDE